MVGPTLGKSSLAATPTTVGTNTTWKVLIARPCAAEMQSNGRPTRQRAESKCRSMTMRQQCSLLMISVMVTCTTPSLRAVHAIANVMPLFRSRFCAEIPHRFQRAAYQMTHML